MIRPFILTGCAAALVALLSPVASTQREPVFAGVITGRVTTSTGEPMIGVEVKAIMVKDLDGNPESRSRSFTRRTDDRGVYRLYDLMPGIYVIFTRGDSFPSHISPYEGAAPTYHPSSPRETAAEVIVTGRAEATGIDIRYLGERGRTVSGAVSGYETSQRRTDITVSLSNISSGFRAGFGYARQGDGQNVFTIKGVTDGEYEIVAAVSETENDERLVSLPHRVTVRGADVSGIELRIAPQASISGKVIVEASPNACESELKSSKGYIAITALHDAKATSVTRRLVVSQTGGSMGANGEFTISNLDPNHYFIGLRSNDPTWYVKSIVSPAASQGRESAGKFAPGPDVGRNGLTVKSGDKLTGLAVTITEGAARLRGKLAPEKEGSPPSGKMIVHLIPADPAFADDILRYAEAAPNRDGAFEFSHIAPGKYRLLARPMPGGAPSDYSTAPIASDAGERAKLRKESEARQGAETINIEVDLKPCQRASGLIVKYR